MTTLFKIDDRSLLASVLDGEGVFLGPAKILDGLTTDQANAKPHQLPHSIADIVAHLCFWQEWFNACATAAVANRVLTAMPAASRAAKRWGFPMCMSLLSL